MEAKKIGVASDHAGYTLKSRVIDHLKSCGYEVVDYGCPSEDSCDYADYAHPLASAVESGAVDKGIAMCGSANGITITLNKHQGVRAAICWNEELAGLAREHNDANICSIAARFTEYSLALKIVDRFLETPFSEDERHARRISKIALK